MADQTPSQQRGKTFGELTVFSDQRAESARPLGTSHTPAPTADVRAPSNGIAGYIQHLGSFMRAPPSEAVPDPIPSLRPFDSPSVSVPPIRRMAPQRGTTPVPAQEDPLMNSPPPGVRRRGPNNRVFVTGQRHLWPLMLGRPREVQDQMLEDLHQLHPRPRPRDTSFLLQPLTRSSSLPSTKTLEESSFSLVELTEAGEVQSVGRNSHHFQDEGRPPQRSR
jgi:hypothetical protein